MHTENLSYIPIYSHLNPSYCGYVHQLRSLVNWGSADPAARRSTSRNRGRERHFVRAVCVGLGGDPEKSGCWEYVSFFGGFLKQIQDSKMNLMGFYVDIPSGKHT